MAAPAPIMETTRVMVQGWRMRRDGCTCANDRDNTRDGAGLAHKKR
jgi:hypothetical protein